jgi:hypothetical protein
VGWVFGGEDVLAGADLDGAVAAGGADELEPSRAEEAWPRCGAPIWTSSWGVTGPLTGNACTEPDDSNVGRSYATAAVGLPFDSIVKLTLSTGSYMKACRDS